jgi:NIPSNAP
VIAGLAALTLSESARAAQPTGLIELRRCALLPKDDYQRIDTLTRQLVAARSELGGQLIGSFYTQYDYSFEGPMDEFSWLWAFPDAAARQRTFTALATAPEWRRFRNAAGAMMRDRGDGLLLRPQGGGWRAPAQPERRLYTVMIHDLDGVDPQAFSDYFEAVLKPRFGRYSRVVPFGAALSETPSAAVPGFGLRPGSVFAWFAQWTDPADETALSGLSPQNVWTDGAPAALLPALKRKPEHLLMFPVDSSPTG